MNKLTEIREELKTVFSGRGSLFDSIVPPLIFLILNGLLGLPAGTWGALISVVVISTIRLIQKQSLWFALAGLFTALLALGLADWLDRQEAFYLPQMINDLVFILVFLASLIFKRPFAAYTSFLTRGWPLQWYWQPKVRPAYMEVTMAWALLFTLRLALQFSLYLKGQASFLAWLDVLLGWPFMILVLVASYLYGNWRLRRLRGPSVEEWKNHTPPPWQSQQRGF
jgi:hypothetical protein